MPKSRPKPTSTQTQPRHGTAQSEEFSVTTQDGKVLDLEVGEDLVVTGVGKGGPSDAAGVKAGMKIVEVNGNNISSIADLQQSVTTLPDAFKLRVIVPQCAKCKGTGKTGICWDMCGRCGGTGKQQFERSMMLTKGLRVSVVKDFIANSADQERVCSLHRNVDRPS